MRSRRSIGSPDTCRGGSELWPGLPHSGRAERRIAKIEHEREAARRLVKRRIIEAFGEFDASCLEARRLVEVVVPSARRAAENVQTSFEQGRISVKELLDAHRDQYEIEVQQLDADIRCHASAAKVETLATNGKAFQHGWDTVTRRTSHE